MIETDCTGIKIEFKVLKIESGIYVKGKVVVNTASYDTALDEFYSKFPSAEYKILEVHMSKLYGEVELIAG